MISTASHCGAVFVALMREEALAGVERRFPDGQGSNGEGPFGYVRAAETIGTWIG